MEKIKIQKKTLPLYMYKSFRKQDKKNMIFICMNPKNFLTEIRILCEIKQEGIRFYNVSYYSLLQKIRISKNNFMWIHKLTNFKILPSCLKRFLKFVYQLDLRPFTGCEIVIFLRNLEKKNRFILQLSTFL